MDDTELRALLNQVKEGELCVDDAIAKMRGGAAPELNAQASVTGTSDGDEFARIRELSRLFSGQHDAVLTDIGDDAAVLRPQSQPLVVSVDVAVEGVHFERTLLSFAELGARAMSAAVSDLAAMGARPLAALCSLIAPRTLPRADFFALHAGIAQAARDYACPVIGGNLSSGHELSLSTTVLGALPGPGLYRSGARAGDAIYVTGYVGSAALGLKLLQLGAAERAPEFVRAWRAPRARISEGLALSGVATSAIDISDGVLADLSHICEASGLGAAIEAGLVPFAPDMVEIATSLGADPLALALTGGEDYELVYTLPKGVSDPCHGTRIGRMLEDRGPARVIGADGAPILIHGSGYEHF